MTAPIFGKSVGTVHGDQVFNSEHLDLAPIVGVNYATVSRDVAAGVADATPDPAVITATCSDCGNVLSPGETCEGCYPPAYDADARAEL